MKRKTFFGKRILNARLSFDDGFVERPIYSIKAKTTERKRGIDMIKLIEDNFSISSEEVKESRKEEIKELKKEFSALPKEPVKWTRDEKGNIKSPFAVKEKINFK